VGFVRFVFLNQETTKEEDLTKRILNFSKPQASFTIQVLSFLSIEVDPRKEARLPPGPWLTRRSKRRP
jgi:hypothetical protein